MNKIILTLAISIFLLRLSNPELVSADNYMGSGSAMLKTHIMSTDTFDYRVYKLEKYLLSHNSPLSTHAQDFVFYADKYDLDWRFVVAISGVESTFGKRIPSNSYNAYGWNNGKYYFDSWENSIEHVSKTLKEKYIDDGLNTVNKIARRYAPPSNTWAWKVRFFMNEIESIPLEFTI